MQHQNNIRTASGTTSVQHLYTILVIVIINTCNIENTHQKNFDDALILFSQLSKDGISDPESTSGHYKPFYQIQASGAVVGSGSARSAGGSHVPPAGAFTEYSLKSIKS